MENGMKIISDETKKKFPQYFIWVSAKNSMDQNE